MAAAETFSMQNVGLNNDHVLLKMSQFHIRHAVRGSRRNGWAARGETSPGHLDFVVLHGFCIMKLFEPTFCIENVSVVATP